MSEINYSSIRKLGMPVSQGLINRSTENWESFAILKATKINAATNRLYYSIFQLVYAEMINNKNKPTLPREDQLSFSSRGVHDATIKYLKKRDNKKGREFQKLYILRIQADYQELPVRKEQMEACYKYWCLCRNDLVNNLRSNAERMIL